jgi:glycosyltransferase involved in cell wall biosynthesis
VKVVGFFPEPTPYRAPLLDLVSRQPDVELLVAYAARTVASRTWDVPIHHRAVLLPGYCIPGARRVLRHDYPVTPSVVSLLRRERPDCVVASGWSTFASQAAIAWSRLHRTPYLLVVESHDGDPRAAWRRAIKGAVVPSVVKGAAGVLVTGSLVRESMIRRGADSSRIRVFANTVDVAAFRARSDELRRDREELRRSLGLRVGDVAVLCVARLVEEKGIDTLLRACARVDGQISPVLAGEGPARTQLESLARSLGLHAVFLGAQPWERIAEVYAAADVFALLSRHEPWGVVVNEAAACGLPLVLSEHVGAAPDLLEDGRNGFLVGAADAEALAARALQRLCDDESLRAAAGRRSAEIAAGWGYEPSVEAFVAAVQSAAATR